MVSGGVLHGTLLEPTLKGRYDVALIVPGSGPSDRDGNGPSARNDALKMLAEGLLAHGIGTLRFDKRGVRASAAALTNERYLTIETYVADTIGWLDYLAGQPRIGTRFIVGHSEGALIGNLAALDADIGGFVSLGGMGTRLADTLSRQLAEAHLTPSLRGEAMSLANRLAEGETVESVPTALSPLFRPSVQAYLHSWFRYDPADEIAKLRAPVLIVQGTHDIQVGVIDAARLAGARPEAELRMIEGMNHVLKMAPRSRNENIATYDNPNLPLAPGLVEAIVEFFSRAGRGAEFGT